MKTIKNLVIAALIAIGATTAVATFDTATPAAATSNITCTKSTSGGQYGSTCSKFNTYTYYQKVRVYCSDGLSTIAYDGPTRYVYSYPTTNWSWRGGCPLGMQFLGYAAYAWRG